MKLINVGNFLKRYEDNIPGDTIQINRPRYEVYSDSTSATPEYVLDRDSPGNGGNPEP